MLSLENPNFEIGDLGVPSKPKIEVGDLCSLLKTHISKLEICVFSSKHKFKSWRYVFSLENPNFEVGELCCLLKPHLSKLEISFSSQNPYFKIGNIVSPPPPNFNVGSMCFSPTPASDRTHNFESGAPRPQQMSSDAQGRFRKISIFSEKTKILKLEICVFHSKPKIEVGDLCYLLKTQISKLEICVFSSKWGVGSQRTARLPLQLKFLFTRIVLLVHK